MYYCCGLTGEGNRPHNEDALLIHQTVFSDGNYENHLEAPFLMAVADGVGGESAGEEASILALSKMAALRFSRKTDLLAEIMKIHESIQQDGMENPEHHNMQTTLCGIGIDETEKVTYFNVGDSRLYLFRHGILQQLSKDQSYVQMLYDGGAITREERSSHAYRNWIMPVLGSMTSKPNPQVLKKDKKMHYGDLYLLCSDGLSGYLHISEMEDILNLAKPLPKRLEILYQRALANGSKDNISVSAVVRYQPVSQ